MEVRMANIKAPNSMKMIADAFDLFDVAKTVSLKKTMEERELVSSSTTSYFFLGTAIELALLGYLSYKGFCSEELATINHDLEIALEKAYQAGLENITNLTDAYIGSVKALNSEFKFQNIEKSDASLTRMLIFSHLENGTQSLLKTIANELDANSMTSV
jgi:DNA-directed RNA polymerase specialized sigma54-like protein